MNVVDRWLAEGATAGGLSGATLDRRAHAARQLAAELAPGAGVETATAEDVRGVLRTMTRRGLSPATAAHWLGAMRSLFRYLLREGLIAENPVARNRLAAPRRAAASPARAVARGRGGAAGRARSHQAPGAPGCRVA